MKQIDIPCPISDRTFAFAVRVVKLCEQIEAKSWIGKTLAAHLLRAGTSIVSNVQEAEIGQSRADIISKTGLALQEARKAHFWLRLFAATNLAPEPRLCPLRTEVEELTRILGTMVRES